MNKPTQTDKVNAKLRACVHAFVMRWKHEVQNDLPISGSDAVEWIGNVLPEFIEAYDEVRRIERVRTGHTAMLQSKRSTPY